MPPQQVIDDTRQGAVANIPKCSPDRMERWTENKCLRFTKGKIKQDPALGRNNPRYQHRLGLICWKAAL